MPGPVRATAWRPVRARFKRTTGGDRKLDRSRFLEAIKLYCTVLRRNVRQPDVLSD